MLTLVVVGAIWRLMQGPIELDHLIPLAKEVLESSGNGLAVEISGVKVGIDPGTHQIDVRVRDVRLAQPDGTPLANFPEMATSFSPGALLHGRLAPTRVAIERPALLLTREATGGFRLRVGDTGSAARDIGLDDPAEILAPLRPGSPWGRLERVDVRGARVIVDDRLTGHVWQANRIAATLRRTADGADGDLSFALSLGDSAPELHASYRYAAATRMLDLEIDVEGLQAPALAVLMPALAGLAQAQFPVSGTLAARLDLAAGRAEGGRLDLAFGEGRWDTPLFNGGLPFDSGELHADYAPESGELRLEKLALKLHGGVRLALDGTLAGAQVSFEAGAPRWPTTLDGTFGLTLSHVPAGRLDSLWPNGVSTGGRRWVVANITDGTLDQLVLNAAIKLDLDAGKAEFSGARGTMQYHDLTVNYFNGLPPARKTAGTAVLGDGRLDFTATAGAVKGLKATAGTVSISDLGAPVETLTADFTIAGPLQDALEVIDAKPLRYAHDAGLDPARAGGRAQTQVHFRFPLLDTLKLDAVEYSVKAALGGISYGKIALGKDLSDGEFALELDRTGVRVQGNGKLDTVPATVDATLYFHPKTGPRGRYRVTARLDDAARARLGWGYPERVDGPVGVDLTYTLRDAAHARLEANLELADAVLESAELGWKKPAGLPASAKIVAELENDVIARVPEVAIKAPGVDGRFAATLSPDRQRVDRVEIRRLVGPTADIAGNLARRPDGGWHVDLRGARLDLSRRFKHATDDDAPDDAPPLSVDARLDRLILGPKREVRAVSASMLRVGGAWQSMRIDAAYPDGNRLKLNLGPAGGVRRLHFESDDLGAALALLGVADNVGGGRVAVDGTVTEEGGRSVVRVHVDGRDYTLARSPTLVRLLSLASFEGLLSVMSGANIPFTTLRGDITYTRGRLAIDRLFAYGGALGVTAQGWFDPGREQLDIGGTVAPAYALNSILGNLPVIGSLLMGGEGQSLFAASFRLSGSSDDPGVAVNPLSGLTPGVLRHLFDPFTGTPSLDPQQEAGR